MSEERNELFYISVYVAEGREYAVPRDIVRRTLDILTAAFKEAIDDGVIDLVYHDGG